MFSFKKIYTLFVLLLLIFSIIPAIPIVSADPIEGTAGKINVLYLGYNGYPTIHVIDTDNNTMYNKDDFEIYTITFNYGGYQNELDDYDLTTFDIIIVDMTVYDLFGEFGAFEDAHNSGVTLVAVANSWEESTPIPDFFDFRDTPGLSTNGEYPKETIDIFFAMYNDANDYFDDETDQIHLDYAENMLMFLSEARCKKTGEHSDIIDRWEQNKIKIAFLGFSSYSKWGLVNQYSSFMNVTFLPDYYLPAGQENISNFGNIGGFNEQDLILMYMIVEASCTAIDANITASENKLKTIAESGDIPVYVIRSLGPDYATEIDGDYALTRTMGEDSAQILIFVAQKYEKEIATTEITKDWVLKKSGILYGIYHPDLPGKYYATLGSYLTAYAKDDPDKDYVYNPDNLTVGIWFHKSYFNSGHAKIIDELIYDLESKGVNVIAGFDIFTDLGSGNPMLKYFSTDGTADGVLIGSAISLKDFGLSYYDYDAGIEWLTELNVTVQKAVIASTGASTKGIPKDMLVYSTVTPNRDSMTDFIILGNIDASGPVTFQEQKDWLANRAIKYAALKQKPNVDKNVAIMYYSYPPGKDNIGANYLNVMKSLGGDENGNLGVLRAMKADGYAVSFDKLPIDENELTDETLLDLILRQGINVGSYAPGVLDNMVKERGAAADNDWWGATLLPVETYKIWFDDIENETIKQSIISEWGEPWNYSKKLDKDQSGMVWENESGRFFVIPAIRFGNVWLTPQPDRALATTKAASYHGGDIPPTHQYVAYYLWLNNMFEADAIISFGTHGTHEWLPGEPYGLNAKDDLAPLLLKDIPNIYLYIVANVGEGLTAEYRGNALIIDHMTPPMIRSNLDSNADLFYLETEIQAYLIGQDGETNRLRQEAIVDRMFDAGIQYIIGIDHFKRIINPGNPQTVTEKQVKDYLKGLPRAAFSDFLREELYDYIESVKENNLPYGMHVYGQSMPEEKIASMLRSMWGPPFDQIIYETYYKGNGYAGIPYEDEQKINNLVKDLEAAGSPAAMMNLLNNAFNDEKYKIEGALPTDTDHEKIVRFILGPVMDIQGDDADAVIAKWKHDTDVYEELADEIIFAYYFYTEPPSDADIETAIKNIVQYCIDEKDNSFRVINADVVNEALTKAFKTQAYQNQAIVAYMTGYGRLEYADRLRECGPSEMASLLSALSGGYIPPSPGNDPIQNKDAIPTGRNFYGIDPTKFPTKSAWEVGKSLANQLIADYYAKYGEFPNTVAFSRFGTEFIRDEGALEACALYLLGVEPVWDINGNVDPKVVKVIPLSELTVTLKDGTTVNRPRIDIVYATAGMRDAFGDKLKMINVGVRTVSNLVEDDDWNYVKVNTAALRSNPATAPYADMRCFANELGNYEIGTGNKVSASGSWEDSMDITNIYLDKMGHVYGDDSVWGVSARALLEALLKKTDATVHASSSNLYDSLDNDDFYQYFGALNLAVQHSRADGRLPEMYVADTRNVGQSARDNAGKMYTMTEFINIDMEARYKNEEWIAGMMESGYAGSSMFSDFVDNLFGWAVTTNGQLVSFKDWSDVFDIYVSDKYDLGLADYYSNNPYAYQSLTGRMLESIRKEYMTAATDEQREKLSLMEYKLVNDYVQSVIDYGVVCCDHTCGNPRFDTFMKGQMSVLGIDPEKEQQYWAQVTGATYRGEPQSGTTPTPGGASGGGGGYGMAAGVAGPGSNGESGAGESGAGYDSSGSPASQGSGRPGDVFGYEMTESYGSVKGSMGSIRDFLGNPSFSSSNAFVLLGIIGLCAAVFYGFKKKNI